MRQKATHEIRVEGLGPIGLALERHDHRSEVVSEPLAVRAAEEVFFSGTTIEVLPVVKIDDRPIADGAVGPITQKLYETLHAKMP